MWPIEAKVLETSGRIAEYIRDVKQEFLTCRYAPFSNSGAMLGYLLEGNPNDALLAIENSLGRKLWFVPEHLSRPSRRSNHNRTVPSGKPYPPTFDCYHLILQFPDMRRSTT